MSSEPDERGRVIAFEGVDGAGKSTVLELVAAGLREAGERVCTPRLGKRHASKPVREIRALTRDRTNLELRPRAELLLYAAREAQVLDEHVRPALARGETVLLDRSLLTPVVLGAFGRGLDLPECEALARAAAAGLEPELTVVFDAALRTSVVRKKLAKVRDARWRDGGRKGLSGSGLKQRIRDGYVELACRDDHPLVHTERSSPAQVAARVLGLLAGGELDEPDAARVPWWIVDPQLDFADAVATLPSQLQLYFTRDLALGRPLRAAALDDDARLAVWAADLDDPLLARASTRAPRALLRRLRGLAQGDALREQLADAHPAEVARGLAGRGAAFDPLREHLAARAPGAVVESLAGREDAFALALRARLWDAADAHEQALGLAGCDGDEAWRRRAQLLDRDPAVLLANLAGLDPARVDPILRRFAAHAPKPAVRALVGRGDGFAHDLREQLLDTGAEVLASLVGLVDPRAWALRERCVERWPHAVLASVAGLAADPRARSLIDACRAAAPDDLFVKRELHRVAR